MKSPTNPWWFEQEYPGFSKTIMEESERAASLLLDVAVKMERELKLPFAPAVMVAALSKTWVAYVMQYAQQYDPSHRSEAIKAAERMFQVCVSLKKDA